MKIRLLLAVHVVTTWWEGSSRLRHVATENPTREAKKCHAAMERRRALASPLHVEICISGNRPGKLGGEDRRTR